MTTTAASDQMLTAVSPGNGESVTEVPREVSLTFAAPLPTGVRVEVRTPAGQTQVTAPGDTRVDGTVVTVPVPPAGPGDYTVAYAVGPLAGETGFTVLAPGEAPPVEAGTTSGAVVSILLVAALVGVVVLTVRRWRAQ